MAVVPQDFGGLGSLLHSQGVAEDLFLSSLINKVLTTSTFTISLSFVVLINFFLVFEVGQGAFFAFLLFESDEGGHRSDKLRLLVFAQPVDLIV